MSSASATGTPYRRANGTAMLDLPTPDAPQMSVTIHEVLLIEAFTAPILADHRRRSSRCVSCARKAPSAVIAWRIVLPPIKRVSRPTLGRLG